MCSRDGERVSPALLYTGTFFLAPGPNICLAPNASRRCRRPVFRARSPAVSTTRSVFAAVASLRATPTRFRIIFPCPRNDSPPIIHVHGKYRANRKRVRLLLFVRARRLTRVLVINDWQTRFRRRRYNVTIRNANGYAENPANPIAPKTSGVLLFSG